VIQVVEFAYNSDLRYLSFEAGAKRRLFDSHLFTELTLAFMFKISDNSTHLERVVSPAELPFSDGSTEREFPYREISGLRSFNLVPSLSLGYDANLGNNLYAGISAGVKFPLMSQTSANNWIRWQTGINVSLHWGVGKYELF
jgi:hypothetical protein